MLDKIKEINSLRGRDYDHPLPNFLRIGLVWSIQNAPVVYNPILVAEMMNSFKLVRLIKTTKYDTYLDIMGYTNTIDMMAELYHNMGYCLKISTKLYYKDLSDDEKERVIETLKNLTIAQQSALLIDVMNYLDNKNE